MPTKKSITKKPIKDPILDSCGNPRYETNPVTGCWNWKGATQHGYGVGSTRGRSFYAHRYMYVRMRGKIPKGLEPDHLCRNRTCINPYHLELVTRAINARRGARAKLSQSQVDEIRRRWKQKTGQTQVSMGKEFGVDSSVISEIVNWKIWR